MQRWGYQVQRGVGERCAQSDATLLTGLLWRILAVLQDIATVALPIGIPLQYCFDSSRPKIGRRIVAISTGIGEGPFN